MQAIIIAAGESSRFWPLNNGIHKSQIKLLGKSLIYWTLKGLAESDIKNVVVVTGKDSSIQEMLKQENVRQLADGIKISYVVQDEALGTGNALWQAKDLIKESFFLLWPNKIRSKAIVARVNEKIEKDKADVIIVGAVTEKQSSEFGMIERENGIVKIVEKPTHTSSNIRVVGVYYFQPDFFAYYEALPKHHETDLVDVINVYTREKKADYVIAEEDIPTLKYPWEPFGIMDALFDSEYFQREPQISETARIGKNVTMNGPVYVGENTIVRDGTVMEGPIYIGNNCEIGQYNVMRGPVNLEHDVKTGAFVDIKHSIVQEGTTFHSGYIGDSIVGRNCRFGAGFITGNRRFDGRTVLVKVKGEKVDSKFGKLGVMVGDNCAFGIHAGTMPGMLVGSNCQIGPATHIFENVDNDMTVYAKEEKVVKKSG